MTGLFLPFGAVIAGFISFSSPCCLPLIPGYLSYVSALPVSELGEREARRLTLRASLLFVAGFTTVFTTLGVAASALGSVVLRNQDAIVRGFGVAIIVLGLVTVGILRIPVLQRERRFDLARVPRGPAWAFPLGMAFAAGWAPCVGPVLATILTTASITTTAAWGGVLLLLYSVGLARSVASVWLPRLGDGLTRPHRESIAVTAVAAVALIGVRLNRRRAVP